MIDAGNSYKDRVSRLISWGHWFLFANIVLAIGMSVRYIFSKNVDDTLLSIIYLIVTLAGHFGLLGILCYIIVLFPLTFIFPSSKVMRAIGAVVATTTTIALLIDGSVYQNYQLHLNLFVFDLDGFNLNNSIGWGTISLFLLSMLTVELTLANLIWKRLAKIRSLNIGNTVAGVFFGAFVLSHLLHIWADATLYQPILGYERTLPFSHGSTARGMLQKYGWLAQDATRQDEALGATPLTITYPLNPMQCVAQTNNNILFINLSVANQEFVTPNLMPNLSKLASSSIVATEHISTSLDSDLATFGINTGLPSQYAKIFNTSNTQPLLSSVAQNNGYEQQIFDARSVQISKLTAAKVDQNNTQKLLSFLDSHRDNSYFAQITLYSSQELDSPVDFKPTIVLDSKQLTAPERVLATQYLRSLAYVDTLIAQIFDKVDLESTTVVVTANRGMDLTALYNSSNQYSKINLHVPLITHLPNEQHRTVSKLTSHYDILPTLLQHHFRCSNRASDFSVGSDILSNSVNELIYIGSSNDFAIYQQQQIAEIDRHGNFRFYDTNYNKLNDGHLEFQAIIDLMAKQRRFAN